MDLHRRGYGDNDGGGGDDDDNEKNTNRMVFK